MKRFTFQGISVLLLLLLSSLSHAQVQLAFTGTPTVTGTTGVAGSTYTYSNIGTTSGITIRGVFTLDAITGSAVLQSIDGTSGGSANAWQPIINGPNTASGSCWGMRFTLRFYNNATGTPLTLSSFRVSAIDVDGDGSTLREFDEFIGPSTYTVENPTNLAITASGGVYNFRSPQTQYTGISLSQTNVAVTCVYNNRNSITMRLGSCCQGGTCTATGTNRQYSLNFFDAVPYGSANTVLPVTFISIHGEPLPNGNKISWEVGDELNLKGYDVERSSDGVTFSAIGNVPYVSAGNTNSYSFTDPSTGTYFYRIKSIDIDGKYNYSRIIKVTVDGTGNQLSLISNPVQSNLEFEFISGSTQQLKMQVVDLSGRVINTRSINVQKGTNIFRYSDLGRISTGTYILSLIDERNNRYHANFFYK